MNDKRCSLPQLVTWYRRYLDDGKSAAYVRVVSGRYSLAALQRLTMSTDVESRRAAVLALGMLGGAESIPTVGRCLRDSDRCVRLVAEVAFGDLSQREMGMAAGRILDQAKRHADGERYERALELLREVLSSWPLYGEAWYQRGVIRYCQGHYQEALQDARLAARCNPHHFNAYALRGRCYLELERPLLALRSLRRSFAINPSQILVRGIIEMLTRQKRRLNLDDYSS